MNTELLREDERVCPPATDDWSFIQLLRQRLIEEREKNAELNSELNSLSDALADLEAELAEARKDSDRLNWLARTNNGHAVVVVKDDGRNHKSLRHAIDAAMKKSHHNL